MTFHFYRKLLQLRSSQLIFLAVLINGVKSILLMLTGVYDNFIDIGPQPLHMLTFEDFFTHFFNFVVLAPLLETLIFQYTIITLISKLNFTTWKFAVIISATVFALSHTEMKGSSYIFYFTDKWIGGWVLAMVFLLFKRKNEPAFIYTLVVHSSINLFLFIFIIFRII